MGSTVAGFLAPGSHFALKAERLQIMSNDTGSNVIPFARPVPTKHDHGPSAAPASNPNGSLDISDCHGGFVAIDACVPKALAEKILVLCKRHKLLPYAAKDSTFHRAQ